MEAGNPLRTRAEQLYAVHLSNLGDTGTVDVDALCSQEPQLAFELRGVHSEWKRTAGIPAALDSGETLTERVERFSGGRIPARDGLEPGPGAALPGGSIAAQHKDWTSSRTGRYRLGPELARGGMGAILSVWDEDIRRPLAMKVMLDVEEKLGSSRPPSSLALGRFLEEARVTGQLDHPGIVPVHELGLDADGRIYFTMKLVRGEDLQEVFKFVRDGREGWTRTRALGVLQKVCEAMAYAHSKGVIHRDLKPSNIMVGSFGEVLVMDWGLAHVEGQEDLRDMRLRPMDEATADEATTDEATLEHSPSLPARSDSGEPLETMDGAVLGTPYFMPPEQAAGEVRHVNPRWDVYAVGAILYHLLAERMPYQVPGQRAPAHVILARVLRGPPVPMHRIAPDIPEELQAITEKAMQRRPARRYADMGELGEDLRAFLENRVVGAYESGAGAELRKWVRRNKPLASAILAAALLLVAGLATSLALAARARANFVLAEDGRRAAEINEARAQRERANVLRLAAIQDLDALRLEAVSPSFWPAAPASVSRYEAWLERADELIHGLDVTAEGGGHRRQLATLRERGTSARADTDPSAHPRWNELERERGILRDMQWRAERWIDEDEPPARLAESDAFLEAARGRIEALEKIVVRPRQWFFEDDGDRWWHAQLVVLVDGIEAFGNPDAGYRDGISSAIGWGVARRLAFAKTVEERTCTGPAAQSRWRRARTAIAAVPSYGGLILEPQLGLLPLGPDVSSGLWEFWHMQSGGEPERGEDGVLRMNEESGLVFVLLPGGTFHMGAQALDSSAPNHDPEARDNESPVHEVTLQPFFLSKYEMTQGQWLHVTGENPSTRSRLTQGLDLLHPVEEVSWEDCIRIVTWLGLRLPTEAQWEYGTRGGTSTPWWTGASRETLEDAVNFADVSGSTTRSAWAALGDWPGYDDGFPWHAQVVQMRANPFGLHGVHGNIREWCFDSFRVYSAGHEIDPEGALLDIRFRINRGGSYSAGTTSTRSAQRLAREPVYKSSYLGLRPARAID